MALFNKFPIKIGGDSVHVQQVFSDGSGGFVVLYETLSGYTYSFFSGQGDKLSDGVFDQEAGYQDIPGAARLNDGNFAEVHASTSLATPTLLVRIRDGASGHTIEERLLALTVDPSQTPRVLPEPGGGFAVIWSERDFGVSMDLMTQRFGPDGAPIGSATKIVVAPEAWIDSYLQHDAIIQGDGSLSVVWKNGRTDSDSDLLLQRFGSDGLALGPAVDLGIGTDPSLAKLANGSMVATWAIGGIYSDRLVAQLFDAAGLPLGSHFVVANDGFEYLYNPEVIGLTGGGFVIAFEAQIPEADDDLLFAHPFAEDGSPLGSFFQIGEDDFRGNSIELVALPDDGFATIWGELGGGFRAAVIHDDSLIGDQHDNIITGSAAGDGVFGMFGDDVLHGLAGDDLLYGSKGEDELYGGAGDDTLKGGAGTDTLDGGEGFDVADYSGQTTNLNLDLRKSKQPDTQLAGPGDPLPGETLISIEGVIGGSGWDQLIGTNGDNLLIGGDSGFYADRLVGNGGDDILDVQGSLRSQVDGGRGHDVIYADRQAIITTGNGWDRIYGEPENLKSMKVVDLSTKDLIVVDGVSFNGSDVKLKALNKNILRATCNYQTEDGTSAKLKFDLSNLPYLQNKAILAGSFGDNTYVWTAKKIDGAGRIDGEDGHDLIYGSGQVDRVFGHDGIDYVFGRRGSDVIKGGAGQDALYGGTGADKIYGGTDADLLVGQTGKDKLSGGSGWDFLDGGGGNDELVGGADPDKLLGRIGNDKLLGGTGGDHLNGGGGNDRMFGEDGSDILIGQFGSDVLFGGTGSDNFVFGSHKHSEPGKKSRDVIKDFEQGEDLIELLLIDANSGTGGDQEFTFIGESTFSGEAGELRFSADPDNNRTIVAGDIDGDAKADLQIELSGLFDLTADDFIL